MRTRTIILILFVFACCLSLLGQTIYDNGPVSGDYSAHIYTGVNWISDTFTVSGGTSTVTGLSAWTFLFVNDHSPTAEIVISSQYNGGGTVYFDQVEQFNESNCYANGWGYSLCQETATWNTGPSLQNGTYWLTLKNGSVPSGDPIVGLDQNSGFGCHSPGCPSQARDRFGTVPSEAFTVLGTSQGSNSVTPKTTSLLIFGGAFVGVVGLVRRQLG
jgi:hypothetical protein